MKPLSKEVNTYLLELLGEEQKKELVNSLAHGKTVVVSGNYGTGKTTLVSVLKALGYNATESDNVYDLELRKPLECQVRNFDVAVVDKFNSIQLSDPDGVPIVVELEESKNELSI